MLPLPYFLKHLNSKGFTLVEVMVAVSIITIISAATIPNFNAFITSQNLKQAQEQAKNGIRDAQNRAISGAEASSTYKYWYIRFVEGSNAYSIGKTTSTTPTSTSCTPGQSGVTTDETSAALQGASTLRIVNSPFCIFYKIGSADVVTVGGTDLGGTGRQFLVKLGNKCQAIQINSSGQVKGASATCP